MSSDQPFKAGDVVFLKCGGPAMVVTDVDVDERGLLAINTAMCVWFDRDHTLNGPMMFPAIVLTYKVAL